MIREDQTRAAAAVVLAAALFGTTGTTARLVGPAAGAQSLGLSRLLVGGALLLLVAAKPARTGISSMSRSSRLLAVLLGAAAVVAYQPLFFVGVAHNGVAAGTVVALGSAPVITGLIDAVRRRTSPPRRWVWTTLLAIVGVVLVSGLATDGGRADLLGIIASVGAGAGYAVYAVVAARLIADGLGRARTMGLLFGTAALMSVPWWLSTDRAWLLTWPGAAGALWLGVAATTLAYLLLARGLDALPTPTVATLTLAEPLTATLLSLAVLHERLPPISWAGLAILGFALAALAVQRSPRNDLVGEPVGPDLRQPFR